MGLGWDYDLTKVGILAFMVAGTGKSDSETVILLEKMDEMFDSLSDDIVKAIARRTDVEHGVMHSADGYVTAWFM